MALVEDTRRVMIAHRVVLVDAMGLELAAGVLVNLDDGAAPVVSRRDEDEVAIDQWREGDAPLRGVGLELRQQVFAPLDAASLGIQAVEDAGRADGIDEAAGDGGRRARPRAPLLLELVRYVLAGIDALP